MIRAFLTLILISSPAPRIAAESPSTVEPPSLTQIGDEIVDLVEKDFLDAGKGRVWAERHRGFYEGMEERGTFKAEMQRRLAELETSHLRYVDGDDPSYYGLLAIFEGYLKKDPRIESLGLGYARLDGGWYVSRVFAGGPAAAAGLLRGDRLLSVDGEDFHPILSLRGKADRPVRLRYRRQAEGEAREVEITPFRGHPKEEWLADQKASSRVIEAGGHRLGYASMWSCAGQDHAQLLADALRGDLQGIDALILDLRGGWGGCSPELLHLFNPAAPELVMISRDGERSVWPAAWHFPVVLLVDGGSRSGKEMVARAFQRHGLARLVGETTAGAVVAGRVNLLADDSLLYLAVSDVRIDGERLEGVGVRPDVEVAAPLAYAAGADPQLERAIGEATRLVAERGASSGADESDGGQDRSKR